MAHDRERRYSEVAEIKSILSAIEKTPRLVAGAGAAGAKVPVLASPRAGVTAGGRGPVAPRPLAAPKSSSTATILAVLILLVLAAGGVIYFFGIKPGIKSTSGLANTAEDPGPEMIVPGGETTTGNNSPTSGEPKGVSPAGTDPSAETAIFVPTPVPITPIPYAGKRRSFGTLRGDINIDLDLAQGIDDVVSVEVRDDHWHALRANGETLSSSAAQHGITGVRWADAGKIRYRAVKSDGTVWASKTKQVLPGVLTGIVMTMDRLNHSSALRSDGTLVVWGKWYGDDDQSIGQTPQPFADIVDIATVAEISAAVDRAGRIYLWDADMQVVTREPRNEGDAVVDVEPAGVDFVALTRSGRAFSWHGANLLHPHENELEIATGYFIRVRGGNGVHAAQRADGTWLAWGNSKWGVLDKINSLPPTPDIAMHVSDDFGSVVWIEPNPAYMPGADYTSTARPGSEVAFYAETIAMNREPPADAPVSAPASTTSPPEADPGTLTGIERVIADLRQKVFGRHEAMALNPYLASLVELNDKYLPALERTATAAIEKGDAFTAKAVSDDIAKAGKIIDAAAASGSAPVLVTEAADVSGVPADLKNLRDTYRREQEKIAGQRDTNARAVLNTYITDLEFLHSQIESSRGDAEAAPVRTAIEAARASGLDLFK